MWLGKQLENVTWACYVHTCISFLFHAGGEDKVGGIPLVQVISFQTGTP